MAFLTLNGLPIPVKKNQLEEVPTEFGDVDAEAADGGPFESRTNRLRRWRFSTKVLRGALADQFVKWVEGWGHGFDFERKLDNGATTLFEYSKSGMGPWTSGTFTRDTTTKKRGSSSLQLGSGDHFGFYGNVTMHVPGWVPSTHGWTLIFWAYHTAAADGVPSDGWYLYIVKGAAFLTRGASANPSGVKQYRDGVLGSYGLGHVINVTLVSPYIALAGYTTGGVAAAKNYDDWMVLPFEIPDAWVSDVSTWLASNTASMQPHLKLGGDCIEDPSSPTVLGLVRLKDQLGANPDNDGFTAAAYELDIELREVP